MAAWTIFDYLEADGGNAIRAWIDSLPIKAQAKIDTRLRHLEVTRVWEPQYISALVGCDDIYEIRIVSSGQYRPLGFYGPAHREFTILLGAVEKGGRLIPRDACAIAQARMEIVNGNRNRIEFHRYG
jgi:hypothetical protein